MKNLKTYATTLALAGIIMMGASSAKAGFLLSDFTNGDNQPCTANSKDVKFDSGILMSDLTGIIVSGFTGIIVSGAANQDCVQVDNGILMSD